MTTATRTPFELVETARTVQAPERDGRYRKVMASHEVAHYWAANQQPEANGGNVFFHDGTIFSYGHHFPMARHVRLRDGRHVIFLTTRTYSSSTAKHLSWVRRAIPDSFKVFRVHEVRADSRREHRENFELMRAAVMEVLRRAGKARQRKAQLLGEAAAKINDANEYAEAVGLKVRMGPPDGGDLDAWLKEAEEAQALKKKQESKERQAAVKKAVAEWEVKVRAWWAGGDSYPGTAPGPSELAGTDFLRVKGKLLETSQRVAVPLRVALPVLQMIREGKAPPENFRIDDFTLREINRDEKYVKVGCHTVSFDEIERLAKTLGL